MADEVRYEVRGPVAVVTMNRPDYRNAQNSAMTYALDAAFTRAVDDDAVKVIVLAGEGKHFSAGHDIGSPAGTPTCRSSARRCCGGTTSAGPAGTSGSRARPRCTRDVLPLARNPETDDRERAGRVRGGRADAGLGVRSDRRRRGRVLLRSRGAHGNSRRRVLRAPVGARAEGGEGGAVHRPPVQRRRGEGVGHAQPGRAERRPRRRDVRARRDDRGDAVVRARAGEEGGQPGRGPDGHAVRNGLRVRVAPLRARAQRRSVRWGLARRAGRALDADGAR